MASTSPADQLANSISPNVVGLSAAAEDRRRKPWKYKGYRDFTRWVATDSDFFILRRFKVLNTRVLLSMQDNISQLEARLDRLDTEHSRVEAADVDNGTFRNDPVEDRRAILRQLEVDLKAYNEYLLSYSSLESRPPASRQNIKSVENWFFNNRNAIAPEETEFLKQDTDLIDIVEKSRSPARKILERFQGLLSLPLLRRRDVPNVINSEHSETTIYYSDERIEFLGSALIVSIGYLMLIGPLWWLEFEKKEKARLGIVTGFSCLFLVLLSFVTNAKPFESLAAAAAYTVRRHLIDVIAI
ncbi:MAG: hypothetical protein M1816_004752 [Peltula sp. TS41687]|nr:MAG: hypothetical protein M1816_004752 [Peltula sp. TS41687]